jgi:hypothetical protein
VLQGNGHGKQYLWQVMIKTGAAAQQQQQEIA